MPFYVPLGLLRGFLIFLGSLIVALVGTVAYWSATLRRRAVSLPRLVPVADDPRLQPPGSGVYPPGELLDRP